MNPAEPALAQFRLNTLLRDAPVGTGTFTRCLQRAAPELAAWAPKFLRAPGGRVRYWSRLAAEEFSSLPAHDRVIHPYWATTASRRSMISVLDLALLRYVHPVNRRLLIRAVRTAGAIIAISRHSRGLIQAEFGRDAALVTPSPDPEWFTPIPDRIRGENQLRLGYWGGWHERKEIVALLRSIACTHWASEVEVHVIGNPPEDVPLPLVRHPVGTVSELVRLVDSIDVALYPSAEEGFGLPVFEALLRDKPVVARNLAPYSEFTAEPGGTFWLNDPHDPEDVATTLEFAVEHRTARWRERLLIGDADEAAALTRAQLLEAVRAALTHRRRSTAEQKR